MKKYDPLWSSLNKLLSHLNAFDAVKLVEQHYAKYNNDAPPTLLRWEIEKLEKFLNEAETPEGEW